MPMTPEQIKLIEDFVAYPPPVWVAAALYLQGVTIRDVLETPMPASVGMALYGIAFEKIKLTPRLETLARQLVEPKTVWRADLDEAVLPSVVIAIKRTKVEIIKAVEEWVKKDDREWTSDSEGHWESYRWDDGCYDEIQIYEVEL